MKCIKSPNYNYIFNPETGLFVRWGATYEDNPEFAPIGPEIADIEITTSCSGPAGKVCSFCYKANTPNGKNMSFDTFKQVFAKMCPVEKIIVNSENNTHVEYEPTDIIRTQRGTIRAINLQEDDEII